VQEVINYVDAMWLGLRRITEIPLCLNLAREIHRELLTGVRGPPRAGRVSSPSDSHRSSWDAIVSGNLCSSARERARCLPR